MGLYSLVRPAVFTLDGERAHRLTIAGLKAMPRRAPHSAPTAMQVELAGLRFPNPVGLAPGFDKDAEVFDRMFGFGFGHVEIGTVTPLPQPGNPKPRLFRLTEDRGVINRMGFNNAGQQAALVRLSRRDRTKGIVGVNIGANKDSDDRIGDYARGAAAMAKVADYLTVNVSSPNTPGLRALQDEGALAALLEGVMDAKREPGGERGPPVFLKLAPDLEPADIDAVVRVAIMHGVAALIIGNTTISRPDLRSKHAGEAGGLSGAPLAPLARQRLADFHKACGGMIPLIAAGGIDSAEEAWARIKAGASLVQLYSALVYEGPGLAKRIVRGMDRLRRRDGFADIAEAVGTG
ncbi:quinone-dependent dihydroorotate dehydrogenase [uncultured Parasphingopyxis sp.]|uniref:quinone-dependent dihydroorotate dehydrogenase n=2 Tax=Parasphingopyxis TaxID=1234545 RepID=UPI00261FCB4D|nr:quinone-dependent dihydroorotate dehydrogenase [uncultured Parasphingopyxis sp.]